MANEPLTNWAQAPGEFMRLLLFLFMSFASIEASVAGTLYGDLDNVDFTSIKIYDANLQICEQKLAEAYDLVVSRNKALIQIAKCKERSTGRFAGSISFHKYL